MVFAVCHVSCWCYAEWRLGQTLRPSRNPAKLPALSGVEIDGVRVSGGARRRMICGDGSNPKEK